MKTLVDLESLPAPERDMLTDFLKKLQQEFDGKILSVLLFGSRARGDATSESDVDLAIIVDEEDPGLRKAIRYLAAEVWLEYGPYLSTRVWSQAHWNRLKAIQTGLYRNIEREGVVLLSSPEEPL